MFNGAHSLGIFSLLCAADDPAAVPSFRLPIPPLAHTSLAMLDDVILFTAGGDDDEKSAPDFIIGARDPISFDYLRLGSNNPSDMLVAALAQQDTNNKQKKGQPPLLLKIPKKAMHGVEDCFCSNTLVPLWQLHVGCTTAKRSSLTERTRNTGRPLLGVTGGTSNMYILPYRLHTEHRIDDKFSVVLSLPPPPPGRLSISAVSFDHIVADAGFRQNCCLIANRWFCRVGFDHGWEGPQIVVYDGRALEDWSVDSLPCSSRSPQAVPPVQALETRSVGCFSAVIPHPFEPLCVLAVGSTNKEQLAVACFRFDEKESVAPLSLAWITTFDCYPGVYFVPFLTALSDARTVAIVHCATDSHRFVLFDLKARSHCLVSSLPSHASASSLQEGVRTVHDVSQSLSSTCSVAKAARSKNKDTKEDAKDDETVVTQQQHRLAVSVCMGGMVAASHVGEILLHRPTPNRENENEDDDSYPSKMDLVSKNVTMASKEMFERCCLRAPGWIWRAHLAAAAEGDDE